jgi:hypothetical protein
MLADICRSVFLQKSHSIVYILVENERSIVAQEVLSEDSGKAHPHIRDAIGDYA